MLSDTTWVSYLLLFKNDFTFSTSFYIHRRFYFRSCFIKDMCSIISIQLHKSEVSLMLNQSIPLAFLRTNIVIFLRFIDLFFFFWSLSSQNTTQCLWFSALVNVCVRWIFILPSWKSSKSLDQNEILPFDREMCVKVHGYKHVMSSFSAFLTPAD